MRELRDDSAVVLFSGGQDSATCLAWALRRFKLVETVGFDYGQRHGVELTCRDAVRAAVPDILDNGAGALGADHTMSLSGLAEVSETAMTREVEITMTREGLPSTFVPGRNILFLTYTAALAYRRGIRHIVAGVCESDFSGYPDCRDDTIKAVQVALNLGMDTRFVVHTPLMWIDKAQTWRLAESLGGVALVELILEETHSCYLGERGYRHAWGYGCGQCPACELRARGWERYRGPGIEDDGAGDRHV